MAAENIKEKEGRRGLGERGRESENASATHVLQWKVGHGPCLLLSSFMKHTSDLSARQLHKSRTVGH